jgi:predicted permease
MERIRDWEGADLMTNSWQDLRYGARMLAKKPGFTLVAVITLSLGIGANTAIFSLVNAILLRPLPVADPARLVTVSLVKRQSAGLGLFSYLDYQNFRDKNEVLVGLAAYRFAPMNLSAIAGKGDNNERVWGYIVSGNYFDLLGVKAALGRTFSSEEGRTPDAHPVVVLSHGCFERRFRADPGVVGRTIILNGRQFTVIGIAPEGFTGTEHFFTPEIWAPSMMQSWIDPGAGRLEQGGGSGWFTVGRLKPGVSAVQAQAALGTLAAELGREYPPHYEGMTVQLTPPGLVIPAARTSVLSLASLLMVTVGMVLAVACANLAGLLLTRATARRQEIAIRLALGASRWRLVRQLLTESVLLAGLGGGFGLLLAFWMADLVMALKLPLDIAVKIDLQTDWRVLSFTLLLSLLTGVLFGLIPALQATKTDLVPVLKNEPLMAGYRRSRLRNSLIVAQLALSFVLLIAAGLMVRSLQRMQMLGPGFETEHAAVMSVNLSLQGYDEARAQEFYRQLTARVESLPGVQSASITSFLPLSLHYLGIGIHLEGQPPERGARVPEAMQGSVGLNYFATMGIPLIAGRDFTAQDKKEAPSVAIINETFARRFWPGQSAIGKRFRTGNEGPLIDVIGVARDGKYFSLSEEPRPFVYRPLLQSYVGDASNDGTLIVCTVGDPGLIVMSVRHEIEQLDASLPVFDVKTLTEHMRLSLFPLRAGAAIVGGFGLLALALAATGIYGVMAYAVAQRTHEIGIRMALGAQSRDVLQLVVKQGMILALLGVMIGLAASLALTRLMSNLLFGVSAIDSLTFIVTALLLVSVALVACWIPARQATRIDPMVALRFE